VVTHSVFVLEVVKHSVFLVGGGHAFCFWGGEVVTHSVFEVRGSHIFCFCG